MTAGWCFEAEGGHAAALPEALAARRLRAARRPPRFGNAHAGRAAGGGLRDAR